MIRTGETVICRVDRILAQRADVTVISGETGAVLEYPVKGSIRIQDARSFDIDKAAMSDHFAANDLVRAHVLAAGDMKACFLSTTGQSFGVLVAKDADGNALVPVDESHMKNEAGTVFKRKVAKPQYMTEQV